MKNSPRFFRTLSACFFVWANLTQAMAANEEVALVTALEGRVGRVTAAGPQPMQVFVKLKQGDLLAIERGARIQMVFFDNGRQEQWSGIGRLEISRGAGKGYGLQEPQVKILPAVLVKQIAKTPSLDSQGRAGAVRLRAIATPEALEKLENDYKRLRMESVRDDLNPELFLLAGLMEMRHLDRIEQILHDLKSLRPGNMEVAVLASLYEKTLRNIRESR